MIESGLVARFLRWVCMYEEAYDIGRYAQVDDVFIEFFRRLARDEGQRVER